MPLPKTPQPRIQIQAVEPIVDCGRYAVKRTVGDTVDVYATVVKDGHDTLGGAVRVKGPGDKDWREEPLGLLGVDRWGGTFTPDRPGRWQFQVAAWTDRIATWQDELRRKHDLVSPELEAFVGLSFQYADYSMRYGQTQPGPPSIVSTVKINQAGFTEMMDTEAMFRKWFGHARASRLLP